jgi:hypothetical protein
MFEASLGGARHRQKGWKIVQRGAHVKLEPWLDQDSKIKLLELYIGGRAYQPAKRI